MNTFKLLLISFLLVPIGLQAQWDLLGNIGTDEATDFVGTLDDEDLRFRTDNTFRLGIKGSTGWLGLNTTAPAGRFHQRHGDFIVETNLVVAANGDISTPITVPAITGIIPRLMFIESAAAFRVGGANTAWDLSYIGEYSFAGGWDNNASGDRSVAFGTANLATGTNAAALGALNQATGNTSFCAGTTNQVTQSNSIGLGLENLVTGYTSMAIGEQNDVYGANSLGLGSANETNGIFNFTFGRFNITNADHSMAIGCLTENFAENSILLGYGVNVANRLTNSVNSSLVVGFNSNVPTLFVGPSAGVGTTGNVGIGNITSPTQKLDVFGTERLRQMPSSTPNVLITGVEEDAVGDYTLNYLAFPNDDSVVLTGNGTWVPGNVACDWNLVTNAGSNDIVMGYTGACNEGEVGIGISNPNAKLHVVRSVETGANRGIECSISGGASPIGIQCNVTANSNSQVRGIISTTSALANASENVAVAARAVNGQRVIGVFGQAYQGSLYNIGVAGVSVNPAPSPALGIGLYGEGQYAAAYLAGALVYGVSLGLSDQDFKTEITDDVPGLTTLEQIRPYSYFFNTAEFPDFNLPDQKQFGVLAQELSEVLPELVYEKVKPAIHDPETGEVISEERAHLAVNYDGLIPVLIKSVQEQQTMIDEQLTMITAQQAQIEALIQMVNNCCAQGEAPKSNSPDGGLGYDLKIDEPTLEQNVPNPFSEQTLIRYTLPESAAIQLAVYNQHGQRLEILAEGTLPAGEYQARWNGSHLPSGTYLYVLSVNGQDLVKRAVKMN
jgi:hypothetical protein